MDALEGQAGSSSEVRDFDVAIVGASLAGCASAIMLGRAGARVAVVERSPDPGSFKRVCSHFIQSSAVGTLERLGLLEEIEARGGLRSRIRVWTRWGWIVASKSSVPSGVNIRRELLDPLMRERASETPGVELMLGQTATDLIHSGGAIGGVSVKDKHGHQTQIRAKLLVGADGRDSRIAELSKVSTRTTPHNRFAYGGYFEGGAPESAPDATVWMMDPDWAAAFPTDAGLTFYAAMPTKARLGEFRADPAQALTDFLAAVPEAPPIREGRLVGPVVGKIEMPNVQHVPTAPGLALVGDAALAADPLWGVGCGWALQSAEWLADSVTPALREAEPLEKGLRRYRRRHAIALRGHVQITNDYATGRKLNFGERQLMAAAVGDERVASKFESFGTRNVGPARFLSTTLPLALATNARHALATRRMPAPSSQVGSSGA